MDTIIDGYNLIFQCGLQSSTTDPQMLRQARARLVQEIIASAAPALAKTITIVFDAAERPFLAQGNQQTIGGIQIRFADEFDDADSMIEYLIGKHSAPRKLTVVSSDHRLHKAASRRRATPIDSNIWYEQMLSGRLQADAKNRAAQTAKRRKSARTEIASELDQIDWHEELQIDQVDLRAIANSVDQESEAPPAPDAVHPTAATPAQSSSQVPEKPVEDHFNPFPPGYADDLLPDHSDDDFE